MELVTNIDALTTRAKEWDVRSNQDTSTKLVQAMEQALDENPDLLFVCSQEVGFEERAIDVRFADDSHVFMNPIIKKGDRISLSREFDRITKKEYIIPRFSNIELIFQDCLGSIKGMEIRDVGAMVISQALDMLDGIYPSDYGLEIIPEFDEATPEEQNQVIQAYLDSFGDIYKSFDESLSNDDETKEQWNAIKYMAAKSKGEVQFDKEKPLSKRKQKMINKFVKTAQQLKNRMKFWNKTKEKDNNVS